jgi:hypothetical protein
MPWGIGENLKTDEAMLDDWCTGEMGSGCQNEYYLEKRQEDRN